MSVGPLALPAPGEPAPAAPAVQLFVRRAADVGVSLGDDVVGAVARLCRMLDGVPLAIELAAARTRVLTPAEIVGHLGGADVDDLGLLSRPRFRGPERHRSLRQTIEWSYALLGDADRRFFERLAVLAGSFTADDARAVTGEAPGATLDRLDGLIAASLLVAEPVAGLTHYRQLDVLRAFAAERLRDSGDWEPTWQRFVDRTVAWSLGFVTDSAGGWSMSTLGALLARVDGHLSALRWCVDHDETPERAMALIATLWGVVHQSRVDEVAPLAEAALGRWDDPSVAGWADAAATLATCRYLRGEREAAVDLAARALAEGAGSPYAPCTLRRVVAHASCAGGDVDTAVRLLDEAIDVAAGTVPALAMEMAATRAELAAAGGDVPAALAAVRAVRAAAVTTSATVNAVWAHTVEASVLTRADLDAAAAAAEEALDGARAAHYPACESVNHHTLAVVALRRGRPGAAAGHLLELLEGLVARGAEGELRNLLRTAAVLLAGVDRPAWRPLAATAAAMPVVSVFDVPGHERLPLGEPGVDALPRRDAVALARRELRAVRDEVRPTDVAAAPAATPPTAPAGSPAGPAAPPNRLVRRGDVWEVGWAGRTVTLRHGKGLADLARVIGAAGAEIHCLDLAAAAVEERSTGEVIDETARQRYEQRIVELQEDVDEAEANHDLARAERAQAELDVLVEHLAAALGLGGRTRRSGGTAERARSAVTHRLRSTIRRLGAELPDLGRHLEASVRTGVYCSYQPERPTDWVT